MLLLLKIQNILVPRISFGSVPKCDNFFLEQGPTHIKFYVDPLSTFGVMSTRKPKSVKNTLIKRPLQNSGFYTYTEFIQIFPKI